MQVSQCFSVDVAENGMHSWSVHFKCRFWCKAFLRRKCFEGGLFLSQIDNSACRIILERPYVEVLSCLTKSFPVGFNSLVFNLLVLTFAFEYIVRYYTCVEWGNTGNIVDNEFLSSGKTFVLCNNQDRSLWLEAIRTLMNYRNFTYFCTSNVQPTLPECSGPLIYRKLRLRYCICAWFAENLR